jgi:hypothetical protein
MHRLKEKLGEQDSPGFLAFDASQEGVVANP